MVAGGATPHPIKEMVSPRTWVHALPVMQSLAPTDSLGGELARAAWRPSSRAVVFRAGAIAFGSTSGIDSRGASGGGAEGGAAGSAKGHKHSLVKRMGRTEDGRPCGCTDPIKKRNTTMTAGLFGGGAPNRDHGQVTAELQKEQRDGERANADNAMRAPYNMFHKAEEELENAVNAAFLRFAHFRDRHDKFLKAYDEVKLEIDGRCKKLKSLYPGSRFDCEVEREATLQEFFARRRSPDCLIGKTTPFEDDEEKLAEKVAKACVPTAVVAGLCAWHPTPGCEPYAYGRATSRQAAAARQRHRSSFLRFL